MWGALFGWPVVGAVASVLIGVGVGVMSMSPPEFQVAKGCFTLAALILLVRFGAWLITTESPVMERVLVALLAFGLIGLGWVESVRWVQSRQPKPTNISAPFSVEIVKWSGGMPIDQGGVGFWVGQEGTSGRIVSHADLAVFLQVVNLQSFVSQLSSYSIEVKTKGIWRKTTKMNVLSAPVVFFVPPDRDFRKAEQIKLDTFFDRAVIERTVQPHEPIRGWVLLQYEDGPDLSNAPEQFRVSLSDAAGVSFKSDALRSSGPQRNEDAQFAVIIPKGNNAVDLSRYKIVRWDENLIAPLSPPPTRRGP